MSANVIFERFASTAPKLMFLFLHNHAFTYLLLAGLVYSALALA